jgi:hypothetical protein
MEAITIQVDPEIAQAYREADPEKQQKIALFVNGMLKKAIHQRPLLEIMEQASKQAIANGMTPEILASILNDED